MTTNTTKIAGEDMTDEQEIELRKLVLEYGLAAVIEGDQDRPRQLKRVVDYVRALLASKPAVPAAQDTPGWFVHNGATHTLEAAAEAAKTPQALAYAASQKAFLVLERICRAHGYNYQCVIHDWLEQALSTASPAAPAQSCGDAEQVAEAVTELQNIVNAKRFDRETFADDTEFADWVQSRARHTLARAKDSK